MNKLLFALPLLTLLSAVPSAAKTATSTMGVSAQITNGSSASVFIVRASDTPPASNRAEQPYSPVPTRPFVRISFDTDTPPYFVKIVTWDKAHRQLTINF